MQFSKKHLLGIKNLSKEDILAVLNAADSFKVYTKRDIKKVPTLRGRTIINMFFEPSTRTRTSFEIAGKRMSADVINITGSSSSLVKGETFIDTVKNLEAMNCDILIVRHGEAGAAELAARHLKNPVINAGDGYHEHPSQALLDLMTIREYKQDFNGLKVTIVGDILHSRVARSNIFAMRTLGIDITVVGPPTMIPFDIEKMGVKVFYNLEKGIQEADVIMMLRIQMERQNKTFFPTLREYSNLFGLNPQKLKKAKKEALIMHPGPINRGVEISPDVVDGNHSVILNQVTNGVAVRMALMYLLLGLSDETVS